MVAERFIDSTSITPSSSMCCSIRGAVFFLASNHIFYSITQMAYILPVAMGGGLEGRMIETLLAFLFAILFFTTGFMTFRAADEESATLIRVGGISLAVVMVFRFILISLSLTLVDTIPEASFLYVYEIEMVPVLFIFVMYSIYLTILVFYYKDLKHQSALRRSDPSYASPPARLSYPSYRPPRARSSRLQTP